MKLASHSTIQNYKNFSPNRSLGKLKKVFSLKQSEESIIGNKKLKTQSNEKTNILFKSIEQKLIKAKQICERVKSKTKNLKTSRENSETAPSTLASFREDGKIVDNNEIFKRLKFQDMKAMSSLLKQNSKKTNSPQIQLLMPPSKITSLFVKSQDPFNNLEEAREIHSFVMEEEGQQEISIVEQHGAGVLDWGICMGKASQFKILKFLDQGKYGKVYLAQSHQNNMICSVKAIYRSTMDESNIQQLMRQVKIQAFLNHPHIVKLYNFFVDEDSAYLVLQPCLGKNLYENLQERGKIPQKVVKQWIRQICSAVEYMHKNDIIHRDLKPQNILLHQNMIKVCDFGWAVHSPLLRNTQCGTPLYTPPEMVSHSAYDSKIDVWSIGILTYELLYGTIPFEIRHTNDMVKIIEQQVYFSQQIIVSEAAKDFMMNCLHKNPSQRATVHQLLQHQFLYKLDRFRSTVI